MLQPGRSVQQTFMRSGMWRLSRTEPAKDAQGADPSRPGRGLAEGYGDLLDGIIPPYGGDGCLREANLRLGMQRGASRTY